MKEHQTVCGQWRLVCEIGHGAYGTVYLAEGRDGKRAAVKVCRRDAIDEERYGCELRGAKLYSAIPPREGLARMRELAEESWGFYAVMDLADDEFGDACTASSGYRPKTLARVIEGEKALPLNECVKLGIALSKGLAVLQRHHLLHRDIKPGNVIYVRGRPVLSDPGLVVEESEASSLVGTPGYVPPENFTDAAGDVYSLGLTLKAASFGRRIEELDKGPALEADTGASLFPAWWRILNKATDPSPSRRYQSAKALLRDLVTLRLKILFRAKRIILPIVAVLIVLMTVGLVDAVLFTAAIRKVAVEAERSRQWDMLAVRPPDLFTRFWFGFGYEVDHISDEALATKVKSGLEKMGELEEQIRTSSDKINALKMQSVKKRKNGHNDEKEFKCTIELDKERKKTHEEIKVLWGELKNLLEESK